MKNTSKKKVNTTACYTYVLYGYDKFDVDNCFYLKISEDGQYQLVSNAEDATIFDTKILKKKNKIITTIDSLVQFFNTEDQLKYWKFHAVKYKKPTK